MKDLHRYNTPFEAWFAELQNIHGEEPLNPDEWREKYNNGTTPETALRDAGLYPKPDDASN